jgi:hypothetical protein
LLRLIQRLVIVLKFLSEGKMDMNHSGCYNHASSLTQHSA